ncbi:MAG: hypothetical protein QM778_27885 [Myxococcales bacterium]
MPDDRPILDHLSEGGPQVTAVRGTLIVSSLQTLQMMGLYERYLMNLPAPVHDDVLFAVANSWLPVQVAMAHYGACDELGLSEQQHTQIGEAVSQRIMGTFLGTLLRSGRAMGAAPSPWIALKQYGRICDRLLLGGRHQVYELAGKDAVIDTRGVPMFRYQYFRTATVGIARGAAGMFAKTIYARELARTPDREQIRVSLRWV